VTEPSVILVFCTAATEKEAIEIAQTGDEVEIDLRRRRDLPSEVIERHQ